jgi:hypothetical protein
MWTQTWTGSNKKPAEMAGFDREFWREQRRSACTEFDALHAFGFFDRFEADLLAFGQSFHSGCLDRADMDEYIAPAIVRHNESIAFGMVEPLNSAGRHVYSP